MRISASIAAAALAIILLSSAAAAPAVVFPRPLPATMATAAGRTVEPDAFHAIRNLRQQWVQALNGNDLFTLLDTYGAGAVVLPERGVPLLGSAGIGRWLDRWNPEVEVEYDVRARLSYIDRRRAVEEWTARVTVAPRSRDRLAVGGDVFQFEQGGVRVYRRDADGGWRIDRETWSADPPGVLQYSKCGGDRPSMNAC